MSKSASDLFIIDYGDSEWKVRNYLLDWCELSKTIDIAKGYFEIGALLALKDKWQQVDSIRLLMGDEVSKHTKRVFKEGLKMIATTMDASLGSEKKADDYQVQLSEKEQKGRKVPVVRYDECHRDWSGLIAIAHTRKTRHANFKSGQTTNLGSKVGGLGFNYVVTEHDGSVELYIDKEGKAENKRNFDRLCTQREPIEKSFGSDLLRKRLEEGRASRVKFIVRGAGYRSPEAQWIEKQSEMVTAMTTLDAALTPVIDSLKLSLTNIPS